MCDRALRVGLAVAWIGALGSAGAQLAPVGPEFRVNIESFALFSDVAVDAEGRFVIAWQGDALPGGDPDQSVQMRRYDRWARPLSGQLQVNTLTGGSGGAAVAAHDDGTFVVVWAHGDMFEGQRFLPSNARNGTEFRVDDPPVGTGVKLGDVASGVGGDFVAVWHDGGSNGSDTSGKSIQARRFPFSAPFGETPFQVNSYTTNDQTYPDLATDASGNFVVVWTSDGSPGTDQSGRSIQGQRFDADGAPLGGQFQVNNYTTGEQRDAAVARDAAGNFVVVWTSVGSPGTDNGLSVQARRYDAQGIQQGSQFQVNTYTTFSQLDPSVAMSPSGEFLVVWEGQGGGTDTDYVSIQARYFSAAGNPLTGEFQVNTYTTFYQRHPRVATEPGGGFVVTWYIYTPVGGPAPSVRARLYLQGLLFRDDFESADFSAWSSVFP